MTLNILTESGIGDRLLDIWSAICIMQNQNKECKELNVVVPNNNHTHDQTGYFDNIHIPGCKLNVVLKPGGPIPPNSIPSLNRWGTTTPEKIHSLCNHKTIEEISESYKQIAKTTVINNIECDWAKDYVGIHVRRGDKLHYDKSIPVSWEMNLDYANRLHDVLIKYVNTFLPDAKLLVVGDDYEYMEKLSKCFSNETYIQKGNAIEDFKTLSKCKSIIQATKYSTFSMAASIMGGVEIMNFNDILKGPKTFWTWEHALKVPSNIELVNVLFKNENIKVVIS